MIVTSSHDVDVGTDSVDTPTPDPLVKTLDHNINVLNDILGVFEMKRSPVWCTEPDQMKKKTTQFQHKIQTNKQFRFIIFRHFRYMYINNFHTRSVLGS